MMKRFIDSEAKQQLAVLFVSLAFYIITAAPTVLWGDDAAYQRSYYMSHLDYSPVGHPLWHILAYPFRYLPFGDVAYRANLVSALFGALTLWLVYIITGFFAKNAKARLISTAILAVSHTFWQHSVRAEVYTLNCFFFVAVWYLLLKWNETGKINWLLMAFFVWVLSLGNHIQMVVSVPAYCYLALMRLRFKRDALKVILMTSVAIIVCGIVFALNPFLRNRVIESWNITMQYVWPIRISSSIVALGVVMLGYNLMLGSLVGVAGVVRLWRKSTHHAIVFMLFISANMLVTLLFNVPADYVYYMPAYVALAIACASGLEWVKVRWPGLRWSIITIIFVIVPVVTYWITPKIAAYYEYTLFHARDLPGRDSRRYFLWPPKNGYRGAREYGEAALISVKANALILADGTPAMTLWYLQYVEGIRPDVRVVLLDSVKDSVMPHSVKKRQLENGLDRWRLIGSQTDFLVEQIVLRPVYLADVQLYYEYDKIKEYFDIIPYGPIYELRTRHNY